MMRVLKAGEVDQYSLSMSGIVQVEAPSCGKKEASFETSAGSRFEVLSVRSSSGLAKVRQVVTLDPKLIEKLKAKGWSDFDRSVLDCTGTMDARSRVTLSPFGKFLASRRAPSSLGQVSGDCIPLPSKPVRVGDTWQVAMPFSSVFGTQHPVWKSTLLGSGVLNGRPIWLIKTSTHVALKTDSDKLALIGAPSAVSAKTDGELWTLDGFADTSGVGSVDQESGKTVRLDLNVTLSFTAASGKEKGTVTLTMNQLKQMTSS